MTVAARRTGPGPVLLVAAGLIASTILAVVAPGVGVVRASDDSATWFAPGAMWATLIPAVAVLALAWRHRLAALAVAAGAGLIGVARLVADLTVLTDPDGIARPDLYVETTDRSLPFHAAGGGVVLMAADVLLIASGVLAAWWLAGRVSFAREDEREEAESRRNSVMMTVGFLGVLLLAIAALAVPYQGGYLANRFVAVGVPLLALVGAVLFAVLAALAVLIAGTLPRSLAVSLLGGVAAGGAVPSVTAVIVSWSAPVDLSVTVWLGIIGAVVLVLAGLLTRAHIAPDASEDTAEATPSARPVTRAAGMAALVAAGLAVVASQRPFISGEGLTTAPVIASHLPSGTSWWIVAIPLAVTGVCCLVPRWSVAGRAAALVVWAAVIPPMTMALDTLDDQVVATVRSLGLLHLGSGLWCAIGAGLAAVLAGILAGVGAHRVGQDEARDRDDDGGDDDGGLDVRGVDVRGVDMGGASRTAAIVVGAAAVVMAFLPLCSGPEGNTGATVLSAYTVQTWGVWAVLGATVAAAIIAVRTRRPTAVASVLVAAAAAQCLRLAVCLDVPAATVVDYQVGAVGQIALIVAILAAAVILAVRLGRGAAHGAPRA